MRAEHVALLRPALEALATGEPIYLPTVEELEARWLPDVLATQRVFEAAVRDGVRVVFASSSSVYGDSDAPAKPEVAADEPGS